MSIVLFPRKQCPRHRVARFERSNATKYGRNTVETKVREVEMLYVRAQSWYVMFNDLERPMYARGLSLQGRISQDQFT